MVASNSTLPDLRKGVLYFEDVRELFISPKRPKGITRKTFENWCTRGDLVAWKFGGLLLTTYEQVQRYGVQVEHAEEDNAARASCDDKDADREQAEVLALLGS